MTASMPPGFAYLRVPEPSDGQLKLKRIVRSDGLEVSLEYNAWITDRTFIGQGQKPVLENQIT